MNTVMTNVRIVVAVGGLLFGAGCGSGADAGQGHNNPEEQAPTVTEFSATLAARTDLTMIATGEKVTLLYSTRGPAGNGDVQAEAFELRTLELRSERGRIELEKAKAALRDNPKLYF